MINKAYINELDEINFYKELNFCLPILNEKIATKHKKGGLVISIESIAIKNNYKVNYLNNNINFNNVSDLKSGLSLLYDIFFKDLHATGDVLVFTPYGKTLKDNLGIVLPQQDLHKFLIEDYAATYPKAFSAMYDMYLYLYSQQLFYGFEHSSLPYYFVSPQH